MTSNRKILLSILTIGLFLRLVLFVYYWDKPLMIVDETHYQSIAENIINHQEYALMKGKPTSIRPPLYPFFLSTIYFLTGGIHMNAVRITQIFLGLATIYMIYLLGRKIFDNKVGLFAAFFLAVYPSFLFFTHFLLTEILFTFLFVLFIWFFFSFLESKENGDIFFTGLFLGLASLTRSILYPFLVITIIFFIITCRGTLLQNIKWVALIMLGYAIVIGPWAVRNTFLQKELVIVDTMGGLNIYHGNYEHTPLNRAWMSVDLKGEKAWYYGHEQTLSQMNEVQKQKWAIGKAMEFISHNKLLTIKRDIIKAANFWGLERTVIGGILSGYYPEFSNKIYLIPITLLIFSFYIMAAICSVFGIVYYFHLKRYDVVVTVILICYFTGMHALTFGHPRYHLPLIPLLLIFASWGLMNMKTIWNDRNTWSFRISLMLSLVLIGIWIREVVFVEGARYLHNIF